MHAIILAGGKGARLAPHTDQVPKPLIQIGGYPILEIIIRQLRTAGCERVTLCVSHLGQAIEDQVGDGRRFGITVDYAWDVRPLGTAAPLLLVADWDTPALVMNGDVMTALDFAALSRAHQRSGDLMTVAVHPHQVPVGFGVVESRHGRVWAIREKPHIGVEVSTGVQVVDPRVRRYIPPGKTMDMPELMSRLIDGGERVRSYPFIEPWHDIGTPEGLRLATAAFNLDPGAYLPSTAVPMLEVPRSLA